MACLKPAIHVCSSIVSLFSVRHPYNQHVNKSRAYIIASCTHQGGVILSPTKSSNRWVVGQAYRQSESSQRAHPADDPRQTLSSVKKKKPEKISCEKHHKFLQYTNNLFLHFSYSKSKKLKAQVVIAVQGLKQLGYQNK